MLPESTGSASPGKTTFVNTWRSRKSIKDPVQHRIRCLAAKLLHSQRDVRDCYLRTIRPLILSSVLFRTKSSRQLECFCTFIMKSRLRLSMFLMIVCMTLSSASRIILREAGQLSSTNETKSLQTIKEPQTAPQNATNSHSICFHCQSQGTVCPSGCCTPKWYLCTASQPCCNGWRCKRWKHKRRCEP